jgi:hypothetical protein
MLHLDNDLINKYGRIKLKVQNSILDDTDQNNFEIEIGNFAIEVLGLVLKACCFRRGDDVRFLQKA